MRGEAKAGLKRWAEVLAGGAIVALSVWWLFHSWGLSKALGWIGIVFGLAFAYAGWQRARFTPAGEGLGAVQIDERRLGYYGPLSGGVIDLDELETLSFDGTGRPGHWILRDQSGTSLAIPVNAAGAERLYDAFAALPGLALSDLARAQHRRGRQIWPLWRRV